MRFDEVKGNFVPQKQYPRVKMRAILERVIKKGSTDKGSWIVLGFNQGNSAIMFGTKEEIDEKLDGIDVGTEVDLELSGSKRGNVIKDIRVASEGEESSSPSHNHLSDEYREQLNLKGRLAVNPNIEKLRLFSEELNQVQEYVKQLQEGLHGG